jgi:hypothetical protein
VVVPSVNQQLAAIRHTIAKTIVPALDPAETFAAEQAGLVLASLDWAMDVVESEYRYEVVEHADQRALLASLRELGAPGGPAPGPDDDVPADLAALRVRTRELKSAVQRAFAVLADTGSADKARELVAAAARRQTARELAWSRMTGFPGQQPAVAEVLARQQR